MEELAMKGFNTGDGYMGLETVRTCPLREEKSFSQRAFLFIRIFENLQDKAKTSYTLSTRRLRFMSQTAQCLRHISHEPGIHSAKWEQ